MIHRACRRLLVAAMPLIAVAVPLVVSSAAMAVEDPPSPTLRQTGSLIVAYLVMVVLLAAVIIVSLIPSKRGHQD